MLIIKSINLILKRVLQLIQSFEYYIKVTYLEALKLNLVIVVVVLEANEKFFVAK